MTHLELAEMLSLAERCEREAANWRDEPLESLLLETAHWLRTESRASLKDDVK